MKAVYLILALAGAVVPYAFFIRFTSEHGVDVTSFVQHLFVNGAAGGFTADLLISSLVFWVWSRGECRRHGIRHWWLFVLVNLTIGLSCALPLFLYFREAKVAGRASDGTESLNSPMAAEQAVSNTP